MKKGINHWAFSVDLSLEQSFGLAKKAGFESIEVNIAEEGEINLYSTQKEIDEIVKNAEQDDLQISSLSTGLFWKYSLTSPEAEVREKAVGIVKKMLEVASWLKTDAILVVPGMVTEEVPYEEAYKRSCEAIKKLIPAAEKYKVAICVENVWNKFLLSPLEMRDFVLGFKSEYVRAYFDVGNVLAFGYPEHWIKALGKLIKRVHIKDFKTAVATLPGFVNLLEGDVNWPGVMDTFRKVGYDGFLTAELFPPKFYPESLIYGTSASMDKIMGRN
jgi:hexulose-6-phosphate isomerase